MTVFDPEDLAPLARQFQFKPFYYYQRLIGEKRLNACFLNLLRGAPNPRPLFSTGEPAKLVGFASWNESPWDSKNIGYKTARVNYLLSRGDSFEVQVERLAELCEVLEAEFQKGGFQYALCRVNASELPAICVLQRRGFHVVDGLLTNSFSIKDSPFPLRNKSAEATVREAKIEDMVSVKDIASTSFIYDRFHSDPEIPDPTADRLHANWIEDSFSKNKDERVLVAERDGRVLGFISYSISEKCDREIGLKILTIILLASHRERRGEGVAKALVQKVMEMAAEDTFDFVHVGTQLRNIKATNLYHNLNFQLVDTHYTFRKMVGRGD